MSRYRDMAMYRVPVTSDSPSQVPDQPWYKDRGGGPQGCGMQLFAWVAMRTLNPDP